MKEYIKIVKLVWPLALGMVNNAAMQFVDRAYLANSSLSALEAVLPATTLAWVFLSFFQSVVSYSGVFVAQYHGAGDREGCVRSYRAGLLAAVFSAVLLLPLVPFGNWIFHLTASSPALARMEGAYYDIVLLGGFFLLGQMAVTAYFTGIGRTRIIFWVNLVGNVVNVGLDPVLIFGWWGLPKMGVAGAALATVVSQIVQFAILFLAARKEVHICSEPKPHAPSYGSEQNMHLALSKYAPGSRQNMHLLLRILRFGFPAAGFEILNMLSFTIFVFVTGRFTSLEFAVSNVCFTVNYLLFAPMLGFAVGAQTLVGHALGRGDSIAARDALRRTMVLGLGFLLVLFLIVMSCYRPILTLFTPPDVAADGPFLALGGKLLLVMSVWMFFDAADIIICGGLKGAGDTKFVFWWTILTSFVIWLPLVALVFVSGGTMVQLWLTMVLYVLIFVAGSWWRWHRGAWRHIGPVFNVKAGGRNPQR